MRVRPRSPVEPASRQPAPPQLTVVQRLINTNDREGGTDLLRSPAEARRWLAAQGLVDGSATVSGREFHRLLALREALRSLAWRNSGGRTDREALATLAREAKRCDLRVEVDHHGALVVVSHGRSDVDRAMGAILAQVAGAQARGEWHRLKACARDVCRWVFYDRSPNQSGTWCAMAICGSREKARRYYYKTRGVRSRQGT